MSPLTLQLILAPALVGASSLACHRWGVRIGGVLSAFPAIAGPFLLITTAEHGARFTALTANATLSGLLALGGFSLAYGRTALHHGWLASLAAGWIMAGTLSILATGLAAHPPAGVLLATFSLVLAHRALGRPEAESGAARAPRWETPMRIVLTAVLVALLALAAARFGSVVGGALAALPVLASVLCASTHRRQGPAAAAILIRGMLLGMAGFVLFCQLVALLIVPAGVAVAFSLATLCAVAAQALVAYAVRNTARDGTPAALRPRESRRPHFHRPPSGYGLSVRTPPLGAPEPRRPPPGARSDRTAPRPGAPPRAAGGADRRLGVSARRVAVGEHDLRRHPC